MIQIFSKDECKYCKFAKTFMKQNNIPFKETKLNPQSDKYEIERQALIDKTNHRTFPWIFVNNDFLGGYTELTHLFSTNKLHKMLKDVNIIIDEPDF